MSGSAAASGVRKRIVISGSGRAGTTFLVQLLTHMGLDTGFAPNETRRYYSEARAGLEWLVFEQGAPSIVKSPQFCEQVDAAIDAGIRIERVIIPVRNFADAAESRRFVQREATGSDDGAGVNGGLVGTDVGAEQETVLRRQFSNLVEALVRHDIPMTFMAFPRLVKDPDYLFGKLREAFPDLDRDAFTRAFAETARPDMVHDFGSPTS